MADKDINKDPLLSHMLRDIFALNKTRELEEMLNKGLDPNHEFTYNNKKHTLLTLAVQTNHLSFVKLLVEHRAEIDKVDVIDNTPLMYACSYGYEDIGSYLISKGADVNKARKMDLNTPLILACELDMTWNLDLVRALLDNGADINHQNEDGYTALNQACSVSVWDAIDFLLFRGADVNIASKTNKTCLMNLCSTDDENSLALIKKLISKGAKVNELTQSNYSALTFASIYAYPDVVMFLLLCGATVRPKDILEASTDKKKKMLSDWLTAGSEEI